MTINTNIDLEKNDIYEMSVIAEDDNPVLSETYKKIHRLLTILEKNNEKYKIKLNTKLVKDVTKQLIKIYVYDKSSWKYYLSTIIEV